MEWYLLIKNFITFKNVMIVICLALCLSLVGMNTYYKIKLTECAVKRGELELEISHKNLDIEILNTNIKEQKLAIDLMKINEIRFEQNILSLNVQIKKNQKQCEDTIKKLNSSTVINNNSTNVCKDPQQLNTIDEESSKKYIKLINSIR